MKQVIKTIKRKAYKVADSVTKACAPYEVRCTYGTKQATWTIKGALEWVAMCEDITIIVHRGTGELVASRGAI